MSEEIIKVLDYISKKIGVAIDWPAANVYPQVMDVLSRYRVMKIVETSFGIIVSILAGLIAIWCWRTLHADKKLCERTRADTKYYDWLKCTESACLSEGDGLIAGVVIGGGGALFGLACAGSFLLQWIFVPEIQYYNLLTSLIGG